MHPTTRNTLALATVALGLVATTTLCVLGPSALADRSDDPYAPLDRFARVYTDIERNYVEEVDPDRLITAAIVGMTDELDRHSRWLDEASFHALEEETEGRYEGIGVEVRDVDDGALVVRVLPGGPAARDGVKAGDRIVAVDGKDITEADLDETSRLMKGPRGSRVVLSVVRDGSPVQIETLRDRIDVAPVVAAALPGDIAYVRLVGFQDGAAAEVQRALKTARRDGVDGGLILDLRDNPGGLLGEAVRVVDLFVDEGPIVTTRGRVEGEQVLGATRGGFPPDMPVVVLVNGGSASASEVVTGALQDLGRATIIGTRTYGKGSVQTLFNRDGGGPKLTTARYFTPAGTPVTALEGRQPDEVVRHPTELGPKEALRARLAMLDHAERADLLALVDKLPDDPAVEPVIAWDAPMDSRLRTDPQLRAALRALGVEPPE